MLKLGKKTDNTKYTAEELVEADLEEIKKMIEEQVPGAFSKKLKVAAKKTATKPKTVKKAAKKVAKKKLTK